MADLGKAYVNIVPKAENIKAELEKLLGDNMPNTDQPGKKWGDGLLSGMKKAITAAAVAKVLKDAFSAGADLQQSFGGLDTIYGEAAAGAKAYAKEAALAGISANNYAEQAVSIGASLKQAFGGDTTAAMEAANTALLDMADNSAKMGTPLESIQQAYQGFAKQNYTMLDNLKLGYGGTQAEMKRLLADAEKLTGVKYDISNLGDVYSAIHVIQGELGLTGVAAFEAQTTMTGSFNALKASWTNVMAAMTTGEGMEEAMANLSTAAGYFVNNILAMLGSLGPQIPTFISGILDALISNAPALLSGGIEMIAQIAVGFAQSIPSLLEQVPTLFLAAVDAFFAQDWASIGNDIIMGIIEGLAAAAAALLESLKGLAQRALQAAKDELRIGSPSKAFADSVGQWIPPGIAVGIEDNMSPLNASIGALSKDITSDMARATAPGSTYRAEQPQQAAPSENKVVHVIKIVFEGSLAQLGRILRPVIKEEDERIGPELIK